MILLTPSTNSHKSPYWKRCVFLPAADCELILFSVTSERCISSTNMICRFLEYYFLSSNPFVFLKRLFLVKIGLHITTLFYTELNNLIHLHAVTSGHYCHGNQGTISTWEALHSEFDQGTKQVLINLVYLSTCQA